MEDAPRIPRPDPNRPKPPRLRVVKTMNPQPEPPAHEIAPEDIEEVTGVVERKKPPTPPSRRHAIKPVKTPPRPTPVLAANPIESAEEVLRPEKTINEIEATEVEGFERAHVVVGMKVGKEHVVKGKPCEDYVIAVPEHGIVGVADGIGATSGEADAEGLNPAARASRAVATTMADRFGAIEKGMTTFKAESVLLGVKILNLDPNVNEMIDLPISKSPREAAKAIDQLLLEDREAGKKAAALIATLAEANKAIATTGGQTTACVSARHGNYLFVANVGDSRGFIQRPGGEMIPVTREDSLLNYLIEVEALTPDQVRELAARPDDDAEIDLSSLGATQTVRMSYKKLNATPMGGLGNPKEPTLAIPTLTILKVEPGTIFVAATDGITDKMRKDDGLFDQETLQSHLGRNETRASDAERVTALIEEAERRETAAKAISDDAAIVREEIL